jgi:hypothetical protein
MAKFTNKTSSGTSFYGIEFSATPQQLVDLFPDSYNEQNDGEDKTNFDFTLETENGDVFTIYDWKEYRPLEMNEIIEWHIGGKNEQTCLQGKAEVLELLNK